MSILPSTLEYSSTNLVNKIKSVKANELVFKSITNQSNYIELHVDLVYPYFAKARSIMSSLDLTSNLKIIKKYLNREVILTIHFMGELDDIMWFSKELINSNLRNNQCEIYIPYTHSIEMYPRGFDYFFWHDLEEIGSPSKSKKRLQMTVKAGMSGQKRSEEAKEKALLLTKQLGPDNVILDGGWKIDDYSRELRMVSYSSFWEKFLN
ncbi:MAG: hypothetical protein ACRCXZ_00530 [Patescibacteria group bacterium]